uniref:Odorant receptor n=1 Tax=Dendroctonus ponderosae TaxID=77166 RepID=A0AAR5PP76_DENPD
MDVLFFYFIRSPVIQLEILHHYLKHFKYYTARISVEPGNVASNIMMKKCIEMHQKVIKFVDIFNENFSNIMVLDFVQSSLRLASICVVITMTESVTVSSFGFTLIYLWISIIREYYIYHSGNEIIFLSSELVHSVYETDWHEENRQFKYMVAMFMVRAGKPLNIKIGPFGSLGLPALLSVTVRTRRFNHFLTTFLQILRASFSYFSLVTGTQQL